MGQPDFHQVPLNVKLRVEGGEHALKRLVGEEEKEGKTQSKWSRDAKGEGGMEEGTASKTVEANHRGLLRQAGTSSFLWLHTHGASAFPLAIVLATVSP